MVRDFTSRHVLAALLFAGAILPARALQLGEDKARVVARHGAPGAEDRAKNVAIYFWEGWSAELEFKGEVIQKLVYRRNNYLEPSEIAALLQSNGGAARWRETTPVDEPTRQWVRDDGAVASCLAVRPLMITFEAGGKAPAGVPRYTTQGKPKNVVPAAPESISSTLPTFPKLLGTPLDPEPHPASAEPAAPASAPAMRSQPKLATEEVGLKPIPPRNPMAPAQQKWELPTASEDATTGEPETRPDPTAPVSPDESHGGGHGWLVFLLTLLGAAAGGGFIWFKRRNGAGVAPANTPVPRKASATVSMVTTPALDALRSDQYDLLVGEIFRREGYTVELSAAAGHGDSIDLTLRRDAETILVQCKHWKTSRVTETEVSEFHKAMMANGAPRGIFVTAGTFARDAREFAAGKDIDLMDRTALEECAAAVARPGEDFCGIKSWVEEFTAHARIFDPECPTCQGSMVIRHHRANGAASWTCRNHPRCPGRREARLDLLTATAVH